MKKPLAAALLVVGSCAPDAPPPATPPIEACGHSHNDYAQARPLLDALERSFCSVEVDVYLVNGALLVAHEPEEVDPNRTIEGLYLDPLRVWMEAHTTSRQLILLIDVKSEAAPTWAAIDQRLATYSDLFSGPVRAVISGNQARPEIIGASPRRAGLDGREADLDADAPADLIPLVSEDYSEIFSWYGGEPMPADQLATLRSWVSRAHQKQRKVRFWKLPAIPEVWTLMKEEGVDLLNTDDLPALQSFLAGKTG